MAPVVDADGRLLGVLTRKGALRSTIYRPAVDADGRLLISVAVGINADPVGRATALAAWVSTCSSSTPRTVTRPQCSRSSSSVRAAVPDTPIVAGNVVTADGTRQLIEAGADIVKVGVGPGAMCTTRMMTGVGRPQFSAVVECADEAARLGKHIWADGGVRFPRDVALALAGGCGERDVRVVAGRHVRVGGRHAARHRRPALQGELRDGVEPRREEPQPRPRPRSTGPARSCSRRASAARGCTSIPERPGVEDIIDQIVAGVRSACTYAGAATHRRAPRTCRRRRPEPRRLRRGSAAGDVAGDRDR